MISIVQLAYVHGILGMHIAYVCALYMKQGMYAIQKVVF
jgi:hypothetical protein